jgi:integrase
MTNTARHKMVLTDRFLKSIKPTGVRWGVWDAGMPGMAVRIGAGGKLSFNAVRRLNPGDRNPQWVHLGVYPVMTLAEAREAARQTINGLIAGQLPARRAAARAAAARAAEASTFGAVAEAFTRAYLPGLKPKSAGAYEADLRDKFIPALGDKPVGEIRRRDIIELIENVKEQSGPGAAANALSRLCKIMGWALARDISGFETNPAAGITAKDLIGKTKSRDRLLTDAELAAVWAATPAAGEPFSTIYRLLLLTGLRREEIAAARWADLDFDAATLTVQAEDAKNGEAMLVPLPRRAVELFAATPRFAGPYIFGIGTGGHRPAGNFSRGKSRLDAAIVAGGTPVASFVIHDFRRAVRSGLGRLGVPAVVAELCLGHRQPGIVGVYDRHSYLNEKRDALQRWQTHLLTVVGETPPASDNVVPLRASASA